MAPPYRLLFTPEAQDNLHDLRKHGPQRTFKAMLETFGLSDANPRYPRFETQKHRELSRLRGNEVFEAYAQHKTPAAYRVFFEYGPGADVITIIAITPHP